MLRTPFASERIQMTDPTTGIKVIQITSYPTPSEHLHYNWPSITPDNRRVILRCSRFAGRNAPVDLYRCDADGLNLFQLTERDASLGTPSASLSLDGRTLHAAWGQEGVLWAIDVETGRLEERFSVHDYAPGMRGSMGITLTGREGIVFLHAKDRETDTHRLVRFDMNSGGATEFGADRSLYGYDFAANRLVIMKEMRSLRPTMQADGTRTLTNVRPDSQSLWSTDEDGDDERPFSTTRLFGHSTMLGGTGRIQGTGLPPDRCIWIHELGSDPYKLVEGPYFWHSGPSFDGEWIVSDTNWPDCGLQLIHVPTRHFRTLCHTGASGDGKGGHAHPALSQDGRVAVFSSDRTGVSQVYVAHITDEFRESVVAGELDNPKDTWI